MRFLSKINSHSYSSLDFMAIDNTKGKKHTRPSKSSKAQNMSKVSAYDQDHFGKDSITFSLLNETCDKFEDYENLQQELPFSNLNEMESDAEEELQDDDETASTFSGYKTMEDDDEDGLLDMDSYQCKYEEDTKKIREKFLKQYMIISNYMPYRDVDMLCEEGYLPE